MKKLLMIACLALMASCSKGNDDAVIEMAELATIEKQTADAISFDPFDYEDDTSGKGEKYINPKFVDDVRGGLKYYKTRTSRNGEYARNYYRSPSYYINSEGKKTITSVLVMSYNKSNHDFQHYSLRSSEKKYYDLIVTGDKRKAKYTTINGVTFEGNTRREVIDLAVITTVSLIANVIKVNPEYILDYTNDNAELLPFIEDFVRDARARGHYIDVPDIYGVIASGTEIRNSKLKPDLSPFAFGVSAAPCTSKVKDGKVPPVNFAYVKEFWIQSNNFTKKRIIYHELGHSYLQYKHTTATNEIMTPGNFVSKEDLPDAINRLFSGKNQIVWNACTGDIELANDPVNTEIIWDDIEHVEINSVSRLDDLTESDREFHITNIANVTGINGLLLKFTKTLANYSVGRTVYIGEDKLEGTIMEANDNSLVVKIENLPDDIIPVLEDDRDNLGGAYIWFKQ